MCACVKLSVSRLWCDNLFLLRCKQVGYLLCCVYCNLLLIVFATGLLCVLRDGIYSKCFSVRENFHYASSAVKSCNRNKQVNKGTDVAFIILARIRMSFLLTV